MIYGIHEQERGHGECNRGIIRSHRRLRPGGPRRDLQRADEGTMSIDEDDAK